MAASPIKLYRDVLRLHAKVLPSKMRIMGDAYVKQEFRQHQTAKPEFLPAFFDAWNKYLVDLQTQSLKQSTGFGAPLKEDIRKMTDEQRSTLAKMSQEARRKE